MTEPTLRGLSPKDWRPLLNKNEKILKKIFRLGNEIDGILTNSRANKQVIENDVTQVSGLLAEVKRDSTKIKENIDDIRELYRELLKGDLDDDGNVLVLSTKGKIEKLVTDMDDKYNDFSLNVGKIEESLKEHDEEVARMQELYTEQEEKYDKYYKKINKELSAGTTSVALASTFAKKVKSYGNWSNGWSLIFLATVVLSLYWGAVGIGNVEGLDIKEVLLYWAYRLPIVSGIVWLAVFASNRRAELKKLEESYGHKEVMARSYIGYKDSVEQLQKEMGSEDYTLLEKHMNNLLDAISEDSSKFMIEKGESHPFIDLVQGWISKGGKMPKSFSDIAGDYTLKASLGKE